jgi:hypothetical protein
MQDQEPSTHARRLCTPEIAPAKHDDRSRYAHTLLVPHRREQESRGRLDLARRLRGEQVVPVVDVSEFPRTVPNAVQSSTMFLKPPQNMRLPSKGIGCFAMASMRGSAMTFLLMRSRSARDL